MINNTTPSSSSSSESWEIGDIKLSTRSGIGDNWLLCNGDIIDQNSYSELANLHKYNLSNYHIVDIPTNLEGIGTAIGSNSDNTVAISSDGYIYRLYYEKISGSSSSSDPNIYEIHVVRFDGNLKNSTVLRSFDAAEIYVAGGHFWNFSSSVNVTYFPSICIDESNILYFSFTYTGVSSSDRSRLGAIFYFDVTDTYSDLEVFRALPDPSPSTTYLYAGHIILRSTENKLCISVAYEDGTNSDYYYWNIYTCNKDFSSFTSLYSNYTDNISVVSNMIVMDDALCITHYRSGYTGRYVTVVNITNKATAGVSNAYNSPQNWEYILSSDYTYLYCSSNATIVRNSDAMKYDYMTALSYDASEFRGYTSSITTPVLLSRLINYAGVMLYCKPISSGTYQLYRLITESTDSRVTLSLGEVPSSISDELDITFESSSVPSVYQTNGYYIENKFGNCWGRTILSKFLPVITSDKSYAYIKAKE